MAASGTTDLAGGVAAGLQQVRVSLDAQGINRIVLVGDGAANDAAPLPGLAQSALQNGVAITALGLGLEFDETQLLALSRGTGGSFHFVEEPADVARVVDDEVLRTTRVVAKDGWLALRPGPGVAIEEVLGATATASGRGFQVRLGEMSENQTVDLVVRLGVGAHRDGATIELLDADLRYVDALGDGGAREARGFVSARASAARADADASLDPEIEHLAARMRVASLVVQAVASARGGDLRGALSLVDLAAKLARSGATTFGDAELAAKVKELAKLRLSLPRLVPVTTAPADPWSGGGPMPSPAPPRPTPAPLSRDAALSLRRSHAGAAAMMQPY